MYSVQNPVSGIQYVENSCEMYVNQDSYGEGVLFITESEVLWRKHNGNGIRLLYPDIAIHAISKDLQAFPKECLYVMYNKSLGSSEGDNDGSDDESDTAMTEIRFAPSRVDNLQKVFDAMSDCQCLHPDEDDSDLCEEADGDDIEEGLSQVTFEDGAGDGFCTGEDNLPHMTPHGLATMRRLEAMLSQERSDGVANGVSNGDNDDGQFEDADGT